MDPSDDFISELDTQSALIRLRKDGIVHVHFKKNTTLDLELQSELRTCYKNLLKDKTAPFIFSAAEGFILTKEARENFKNVNIGGPVAAYGLIANNLAYRMIANFFLNFYKPTAPFKVFTKVEDAAKWLQEFNKR